MTNIRKKHHILTPRQSEKTLGIPESISTKTKQKSKFGGFGNNHNNKNFNITLTTNSFIVNWFKRDGNASESIDTFDGDLSVEASGLLKTAQYYSLGKNQKQTGLQKAKKRVEDRFNKFVLKKGKKKDGNIEETPGSCKF